MRRKRGSLTPLSRFRVSSFFVWPSFSPSIRSVSSNELKKITSRYMFRARFGSHLPSRLFMISSRLKVWTTLALLVFFFFSTHNTLFFTTPFFSVSSRTWSFWQNEIKIIWSVRFSGRRQQTRFDRRRKRNTRRRSERARARERLFFVCVSACAIVSWTSQRHELAKETASKDFSYKKIFEIFLSVLTVWGEKKRYFETTRNAA